MKRYTINNNNMLGNKKKAKVECGCKNELQKKVHFPSIGFDYDKPHHIGIDFIEESELNKLYFLQFETNGKRRKVNFLNIFNDLKHNQGVTDCFSCSEIGNNVDDNKYEIKKIEKNKKHYMNSKDNMHINFLMNNVYDQEDIKMLNTVKLLNEYTNNQDFKNKKYSNIKNNYYEKINYLLKEIHFNKLARKNNMEYPSTDSCKRFYTNEHF
ncbi:conserved protein, unknown function [Hepatocystis sp. ex Piliocolobus tephrosceles]|nr:conserved protein, unknown function [Hepatocystis sp. ex Piliocolobus tephrosceles]